MRKLLRDDFVRFNQTLHSAMDKAGESTVQRLKQVTGVERLDKAVISASSESFLEIILKYFPLKKMPLDYSQHIKNYNLNWEKH